ncbi:MAG: hypothetical protein ACYCZF_05970 [Anaerolineae bacterium]
MVVKHVAVKTDDVVRTRKPEPPTQKVATSLAEQATAEQALARPDGISTQGILALQHTAGNQAVQRLLVEQGGQTAVGQATRVTPNDGFDAPVVKRFSAEPHEQMSAAALRGRGYTREQMEDIQVGNWATDMNQISLVAPYLQRFLGFTLTPAEQFQIVQLLAVGHFGEQAAARMDRSRLGGYNAAEHFDNPNAANAPQEQRLVASHIATSISTIEQNFTQAIGAGETPAGRQHYGRAMHITQDFFAHTNFVRIATNLLDPRQPEPYGGRVTQGADAGHSRLTSGIFNNADTVMSILHLLIEAITREPEPGRITSGDRIIQMIVNHISPTLGAGFGAYLQARSAVSRGTSAVSSAVTSVAEVAIPQLGIYNQCRDLVRRSLEAGLNAAMAEAGRRFTGTGAQPSHTRMNVDDPASGGDLYPIARALAEHVVAQLDPLLQAAWRAPAREAQATARAALFARLRQFLVHPEQDRWWQGIMQGRMRRR